MKLPLRCFIAFALGFRLGLCSDLGKKTAKGESKKVHSEPAMEQLAKKLTMVHWGI